MMCCTKLGQKIAQKGWFGDNKGQWWQYCTFQCEGGVASIVILDHRCITGISGGEMVRWDYDLNHVLASTESELYQ